MNEIICPHCGTAFKIDESGYTDILKQIRNREFDKALHEQLDLAEKEKKTAIELAETKLAGKLEKETAEKNMEIERLKEALKSVEVAKESALVLAETQARSDHNEEISNKNSEIERLK